MLIGLGTLAFLAGVWMLDCAFSRSAEQAFQHGADGEPTLGPMPIRTVTLVGLGAVALAVAGMLIEKGA